MPTLDTKLTRTLGCRFPMVGAAMARVAGGALAAAVTKAGGFGFIGNATPSQAFIDKEIEIARRELGIQAPQRLPIGAGFLVWMLEDVEDVELSKRVVQTAARQLQVVWFSFGDDLEKWIKLAREADAEVKIAVVASTPSAAVDVARWGVDIIIAQSIEAGGHGLGSGLPLITLVPAVLDVLPAEQDNRPIVLAAGGISTAAQAAAALALGADGFVVGTRLSATPEAFGYSAQQKQLLVNTDYRDSVRSEAYDVARGTTGWPKGIDGRAVRNTTYDEFVEGRNREALRADYETAVKTQDTSRVVTWAGSSVGAVKVIEPAADIVRGLEKDVLGILAGLNGRLRE